MASSLPLISVCRKLVTLFNAADVLLGCSNLTVFPALMSNEVQSAMIFSLFC
ncbi:hypothetical protein D3C78_1814970 [compost metagenome]